MIRRNFATKFQHVRDVIGKVRAVPQCPETAALPWHEWRLAEARLQGRRPLYCTPHRDGRVIAIPTRPTSNVSKQLYDLLSGSIDLYTADDLTQSLLAANMDDNLFANILNNPCHVLYKLLPNNTEHTYNLRSRRHSLSLTLRPTATIS